VPSVLLGSLAHEHEALSVRDDLGGVEGLLEVVDELLLVAGEGVDLGTADDLGGADTLLLDGGEAAGEDSLTDEGDGHAEVEGVGSSPLTGTLLGGGVEDLGNEGDTVVVVVAEDLGGDLDEVRVKNALVPGLEDCRGKRRLVVRRGEKKGKERKTNHRRSPSRACRNHASRCRKPQ
jgi:hypothetical protein